MAKTPTTVSDLCVRLGACVSAKTGQDHDGIQLRPAEQTAFVKALLDPPAPSVTLRRVYQAYKKKLGL